MTALSQYKSSLYYLYFPFPRLKSTISCQISDRLFKRYSHPVRVNALNSVVIITTLEESTPSCPIFFAITKLLTVVADPSITRIAISSSLRNPRYAANGKKIATNPISLIKAAVTAGFTFPIAFLKSKAAPIAIRPMGVATAPILDTALLSISGIGILSADQINPATIPIMIGFVMIPFKVFFHTSLSSAFLSGWKKDKTTTAITL